MAKVILQYPYNLKPDVKKEMTEKLQKDWENGLLVVEGYVQVTVLKDEDVIVIDTDSEGLKEQRAH